MSFLPLTGVKILDLAPSSEVSPAARTLAAWGAELLPLPPGLRLDHPEGMRILLLLVQESDVLVESSALVDVAMLHDYNPMLIVCIAPDATSPWATVSGILAALRHRDRSGLGQQLTLDELEGPRFSAFEPAPPPRLVPNDLLFRLGYTPEAIAGLRQDGVITSSP